MSDFISSQNIEIIHEKVSDTAKKSNKLNYERIKELCTEAQAIRVQLHQAQSQDVIDRLETFIEELNKLKKSSSKYLDTEEVMSDLDWIIEYKQANEWLHVTRWISNLDSSLREMWSKYIEKIIALKNPSDSSQGKN